MDVRIERGSEVMKYHIMLMVHSKKTASNPLAPIFDSYGWWVDLAKRALEEAGEFEMRLWEDDCEGIQSAQKFGKQVPNDITKELVFQGKVSPELKQEILTNYLTGEGYIKWFSLFLKKDGEYIFSSGHYGDETCILAHTQEQVEAIQNWAKQYPIIWRVDVFECE